jgi:hypothetical protein
MKRERTITIRTHYDPPPIPIRLCDWSAIDDNTYDGQEGDIVGYGPTEMCAIQNLLEQIDANDDE